MHTLYVLVITKNDTIRNKDYAFVNNGYGLGVTNDKQVASGSLSDADFHTLSASLNLTF